MANTLTATFNKTWNGAISSTAGSETVLASGNVVGSTFVPNKWSVVRVTNTTATAGTLIFVTTDGVLNGYTAGISLITAGTTPAAGADGGWAVLPGETIVVPSAAPMWWQGFGGPNGNIDGAGLNSYTSYDPPQTATPALAPNPGVVLQLLGSAAATAIVEGAG